nr:MAG TPA: hypothetical protein [Caudoviricetes sp.]
MQKIRIDFDNPGLPQHISAVENDSQSRFFQATLYENGKAYTAPEGAAYSIMYRGFGPQNQGWYDTINDGAGKRAACAVSGNVVTCEIARQALQVPGHVSIVLCVTTGKGYMLKSWPIECDCKNDRYDSTAEIQSFFYITQVTNADWTQAIQALENLKDTIDPTLSVSGKAADAAKVGEAVNAEAERAKGVEGQLKEDLVNQKKNNIVFNGYFKEYNDRITNNNNIIKSILSKKETILTEENGENLFDENNNSLIDYVYSANGCEYSSIEVKPPYWILFLDCARKYFSLENIKYLIFLAKKNGFNQFGLHFSEDIGFRFALDDMIFYDVDGTSYDLSDCTGGRENPTKYYTQSDMDKIIDYAFSLGIDIVPSFDIPGHMGQILKSFPQFKYKETNTLDITNDTARKFGKALLIKYCKYFSSRGCNFFDVGYDEIGDDGKGFQEFYERGDFKIVSTYANELIDIVKNLGLTPRILNEVVLYQNDYLYHINKDAEVLVWKPWNDENNVGGNKIQKAKYKVINASANFYWILQNEWQGASPALLDSIDVLRCYDVYNKSEYEHMTYGAMYSIWCDAAETINPNDNGADIAERATPYINAFGNSIKNFYR